MSESEHALVASITKLTEKLESLEQKVDAYGGDLGQVQAKVDLAMTSLSLVQQEQMNVVKTLRAAHGSGGPRHEAGVIGSFPGFSSASSVGMSTPPPPPPPPPPPLDPSRQPRQVNSFPTPRPNPDRAAGDHAHVEQRKVWLPKMDFPRFDGSDARIWIDKCSAYFAMFQIPPSFRVSAASIHMTDAAAHWYQSYKHTPGFQQWDHFVLAVLSEFEVDTHRAKTMELLNLRQTGSVDEYRKSFEQLVYNIRLYDHSISTTMLTAQFLIGLKEELRFAVEMQLPNTVAKAAILASIQEQLLEKTKKSVTKSYHPKLSSSTAKPEPKASYTTTDLWKAR